MAPVFVIKIIKYVRANQKKKLLKNLNLHQSARTMSNYNTNNTDKITSDPTIVGTVIDTNCIVELLAGFNNTPSENFINVLPYGSTNGNFKFTRKQERRNLWCCIT